MDRIRKTAIIFGFLTLVNALQAQTWAFNQGWTESDSIITIFSDYEVIVHTTPTSISLNEYTAQIDSFSMQGQKVLFYLSNGGQAIYAEHEQFGPGLVVYWADFKMALWSKKQSIFIISKP